MLTGGYNGDVFLYAKIGERIYYSGNGGVIWEDKGNQPQWTFMINSFNSSGQVDMTNEQRIISDIHTLQFDQDDYIQLDPGPHLITFNEVVRLPLDIMALSNSRSSLLRRTARAPS